MTGDTVTKAILKMLFDFKKCYALYGENFMPFLGKCTVCHFVTPYE